MVDRLSILRSYHAVTSRQNRKGDKPSFGLWYYSIVLVCDVLHVRHKNRFYCKLGQQCKSSTSAMHLLSIEELNHRGHGEHRDQTLHQLCDLCALCVSNRPRKYQRRRIANEGFVGQGPGGAIVQRRQLFLKADFASAMHCLLTRRQTTRFR